MPTPGQLARLELARRFRLEGTYPTALGFEAKLDPRTRETPALRLLSAKLTAALRPASRARLILSVPPQEGKTSLSRAAVLRELSIHPDQRFVLASYGLDLARDNSRAIRDDMIQNGSWLGVRPKRGRAAVTNWGVERYRGGVQAAGVGSALVGKPADAVVIDDPVSGAAAADSKDQRDRDWKWWTGTVANRLSSGAPVVLIMCLTGDTPVLMGDGTTKALSDIRPGDPVATYDHGGHLTTATVRNWASQGTDRVYSVTMESGRVVRANARHPFRTIDAEGNEAWTRVHALQPGNQVVSVELVGAPGVGSRAPLMGAPSPSVPRVSASPTTTKPGGPQEESDPQRRLSESATGSTDTDSRTLSSSGYSQNRTAVALSAADSLTPRTPEGALSCSLTTSTAPKSAKTGASGPADVSEACYATTATSSSDTGLPSNGFWLLSSIYGRGVDTVVSVELTGHAEVFDIEVEGTHNFIANGLEVSNTRWHDDDLAGRLIRYSAQPWEVLNIAAQCVTPSTDPLGRAAGEYMISARGRDTHDWEVRKAEAGPRMWSALFQGDPQPDVGGILQRGWWQPYAQLPLVVDEHGRHWLTGFDEVIQSWDLTFGTKSEDADYVVGQTWARRGSQVYLVDQVRDRLDYPEQVAAVEAARGKWPQVSAVLIEAKANGQAVISTLSQRVPGIIPITSTDSKITRTKAISPFVAARTVHIPDPALPVNAWVAGYVEECAAFPTGTHDDQVDTTTQALSWLYQPALREQHERRRREQYGSDTTFDIG